ncbi:ubiquinone anaerobic biosynthesis protein UbiU [Kordiimonas marina]|uniref:ubiquinone anaerobic biosynthesis protein UbiU n=1 Tax=Kordiimonas marina TaxID=2872312 RepID=UPI001FF558FB|nr:peptidase U32 family protein [Kordiimonas marina]MCJ9428205.1 U32 family peptidase [Kordiimonas marina]
MKKLELVCPAGTPAALRVAVDAGADAVYMGFRDETNARNFPGLNFSREELAEALDYAHARGAMVFLAVNTYARAGDDAPWRAAIKSAHDLKVDALILADIGLLAYARETYPDLRLHLSVQASASNAEAINFYGQRFGVKRVVLPRVLTVPDITKLNGEIDIETEVFAFGGMCPMAEGRCTLSSYVTGKSPNRNGVCSPASHVAYVNEGDILTSRLGGFTINRFGAHEQAGYPTLCKGRFKAGGEAGYLFEEPTSLDISAILPELAKAGVTALKIEGRQRGKAYVKQVVTDFRRAVDTAAAGGRATLDMAGLSEGHQNTTGAYAKKWM